MSGKSVSVEHLRSVPVGQFQGDAELRSRDGLRISEFPNPVEAVLDGVAMYHQRLCGAADAGGEVRPHRLPEHVAIRIVVGKGT